MDSTVGSHIPTLSFGSQIEKTPSFSGSYKMRGGALGSLAFYVSPLPRENAREMPSNGVWHKSCSEHLALVLELHYPDTCLGPAWAPKTQQERKGRGSFCSEGLQRTESGYWAVKILTFHSLSATV